MECYYDQAFIAVRDRSAEKALRVKSLPVARAVLGYRGYTREVSPDGEQPLLYDYDHVDPAPLARLSGKLTRFGDVARLLQADDDQLCLVGPGDELRVEFDGGGRSRASAGLDAELRAAQFRLLQGRRSVHGGQRHGRADSVARDAAIPVRPRRSRGRRTRRTNRTFAPIKRARPEESIRDETVSFVSRSLACAALACSSSRGSLAFWPIG